MTTEIATPNTAIMTGTTTLSILPSPSIQLARGLASVASISGNNTQFLDELHSMSAFDLFKIQLECGSTEATIDAMKRLGVVCQAVGPIETNTTVVPYLTRLVLNNNNQQQSSSSATPTAAPASPGGTVQPGGGAGAGSNNSATNNVLLSDELLLLLGQQILEVAAVISDSQEDVFLPLLEKLAAVEETVVRDQAVTALAALCEQKAKKVSQPPPSNYMNQSGSASAGGGAGAAAPPSPVNHFTSISAWLALVKRLSSADWFTAKVSACGIVAPIFGLVNAAAMASGCSVASLEGGGDGTGGDPNSPKSSSPPAAATASDGSSQEQQYYEHLLSIYKELCMDETPMVRRAAAKNFGFVLKEAGWNYGREFGSNLLGPVLCRDEQDSVRLLAVASLKDVGPIFGKTNPQWTVQYWLPIIKDGSTDMSWRVRNHLAKHFSDVATTLGIQHNRTFHSEQSLVMACFVAMLTDAEAEVRAAAVTHLARMVAWGGQAHFTTHLQPLLPALADDVVMEVRSKCALALMDAADGGALEDNVILQAFGPLLENFLQDEFHEVQLQVLSNLHKIAHLLPGLPGVVSTLLQMSKATNWRVREAVAKLLPHLGEARGLEFFTTVLLEPAWLTLLLDPVASVRNSIVRGMALLVRVAGQVWIVHNLLPHHIRIYNQNGANTYLIRITILNAHIQTAIQCQYGGPLWNDVVMQILQRGLVDKVPNVRMIAAKGLGKIARVTEEEERGGSKGSGSVEEGGVDGNGGVGALSEATIAIIQTQIRPALEKRVQEEEDVDVRQACQEALDQVVALKL